MFDATATEAMTATEITARRRMLEVLHYFQAVEKKPWRFDHCSPCIGIREGYRIGGNYTLGVEDLRHDGTSGRRRCGLRGSARHRCSRHQSCGCSSHR
jgi:hypothetical protein